MTLISDTLGPDRMRRIRLIAGQVAFKRYRQKLKCSTTPKSQLEDDFLVGVHAKLLEKALVHEVFLFELLRSKKSRLATFRRRMIYWRMINSYGLSLEMASSILEKKPTAIREGLRGAQISLKVLLG
jgi:hypothetical protein